MKHFLHLLLLLLTFLPAQAVKKLNDVNPINIASVIVEKSDSANIASTLEYYGYILQGTENGYQILKHPNGDEIRYSFHPENSDSKDPTIIVKPKETQKQIDSRLNELDFTKEGNQYRRIKNMYSRYITQCEHGPHNTLIFRRVLNNRNAVTLLSSHSH